MIVDLSSVEQVEVVEVSQDVWCLLEKAVELCKSNGCAVEQIDMFCAAVHISECCVVRLTVAAARQRGWCSSGAASSVRSSARPCVMNYRARILRKNDRTI